MSTALAVQKILQHPGFEWVIGDVGRDEPDIRRAIGQLDEKYGSLSDGEQLLFHAALAIWNGGRPGAAALGDMLRQLDDETLGRVLEAVIIARNLNTTAR